MKDMIERRPARVPIPILPNLPAPNIIRLIAPFNISPFDYWMIQALSQARDVEYVSKWEWCGLADVHGEEGRDDSYAVGKDSEVDGVDD